MCRWFAYFSKDEILIEDALVNPVHAITQQARGDFQEENLLNADGFGVAWYTDTWSKFDERRPTGEKKVFGKHPVLYRATTGKPINDTTFRYLCRSTSSNVILSHIRGAFGAVDNTNNHPFVFGRSSFMHNGFIARFKDIRWDIIDDTYRKYTKLIGGSTDTEHLAALYFSYLDDEQHEGYFDEKTQKDKKYSAQSMWTAMRRSVQKVEEIQLKHFGLKLNNTLNLCTTNGESMVTLCYRTNPWAPPNTLYTSFTVGDEMNRKDKNSYNGPNDPRTDEQLAKAAKEFKANVEDLRWEDVKDRDISHVVVASEPVTFEPGDWSKLSSGQAILVDNVEGESSLKVKLEYMPSARTASVIHPDNDKQVIMFHNHLIALIDVSRQEKTVLGRPVEISRTLEKTTVTPSQLNSGCDAVIPNPRRKGALPQWHLFGGTEYMFVEVDTKGNFPLFNMIQQPSKIVNVWECLKGIKNFDSIDTAVLVPKRANEAWLFKGDKYVRVSWTENENNTVKKSTLKEGPTDIPIGWRSLDRADFSSVNMILPNWKENKSHQMLFFSGINVALVEINFTEDRLIDIPRGRRRPIAQDWPPAFYEPPQFLAVPSFNDLGDEDTALLGNMISPTNTHEVMFFSGSKFLTLNIKDKVPVVVLGPLQITESSLGTLGGKSWTSGLDAVLPNPPVPGKVMHIFSGNQCAAVDPPPNLVLRQSSDSIFNKWTGLKDAGFKTIDALLPVPGVENEVWFFSCTRFVKIRWSQEEKGLVKSNIVEKEEVKQISDHWHALARTKFFQVDSIIPIPGTKTAWFIFDDECILLSINGEPKDCEIIQGPELISKVWPALQSLYE